jgi:hypothetical protein
MDDILKIDVDKHVQVMVEVVDELKIGIFVNAIISWRGVMYAERSSYPLMIQASSI